MLLREHHQLLFLIFYIFLNLEHLKIVSAHLISIKVEKNTRKIIKLRAKTGVHIYLEMRGEGAVNNLWFECECERDFSLCELTPKGKKDEERAKEKKEQEGSDDSGGGECG